MAKTGCGTANQSEEYYDYIVERSLILERMQEYFPNACSEQVGLKYDFLHIPMENTEGLSGRGDMKKLIQDVTRFGYTAIPKAFGLMDTSSVEATGVLRVQNQPVLNLRGQGVILGFVDTGIAYDLPIFQNEDGTSRILGLWDQTVVSEKEYTEEADFFRWEYGTYYNQEEITAALKSEHPYDVVPSRDEEGHGTFLAGIAAGKVDRKADFTGMAPDASLAVVKLKPMKQYMRRFFSIPDGVVAYSEIDIYNAVSFLLELSWYYRKPVVMCIGLGTNQGGHDGRMPISDYMSQISNSRGMAVVQAAGNEGNARRHYYGRVSENLQDVVEIKVGKNVEGFCVELWGNSLNTFYVGIQSPSGKTVPPVPPERDEVREYDFILDGSKVYIYDYVTVSQGGDYVVVLHFQTPAEGVWKIQVAAKGSFDTEYHMWMPITQFVPEDTYFLQSNPYTTLTSNACATSTLVMGMYNHYFDALTPESSKGYTRTNQVKPDLAAPGVNVYGPFTDGSYGYRTGSSIAAAHGAGASALLMEYGIARGNATYMDGMDIRSLLIRGAGRKPTLEYPNPDWGYGTLDVYETFQVIAGQR